MDKPLMDDHELRRIEAIARAMDSQFRIPGTQVRFGLDGLLGLLPGIGDTGTFFVTLYLVEKAKEFGVPEHVRQKMLINALIDWAFGSIPLLGDLFDIGWKANEKNAKLLRDHVNTIL